MAAVSDSSVNQATRMPFSMTAAPSASQTWVLPVPLDTTSDCVRFAKSAAAGTGDLASSRTCREPATRPRLGTRRRRDSPPGHPPGWDPKRSPSNLDELVLRGTARRDLSAIEPFCGSCAANGAGPAQRSSPTPGTPAHNELGSPPNSANHLEVSLVRNHTIAPVRQLRLVLTGSTATDGPQDIWDSLPEEVRREVLVRLAGLISRWFQARRTES